MTKCFSDRFLTVMGLKIKNLIYRYRYRSLILTVLVVIFFIKFVKNIPHLNAVWDQVHESNIGTVIAQFRHLQLTSLYKNPSMLNMRAKHGIL